MSVNEKTFNIPNGFEFLDATYENAQFFYEKEYWSATEWRLYNFVWRNSVARLSDTAIRFENKRLRNFAEQNKWEKFWEYALELTITEPTQKKQLNSATFAGIGCLL